MPLAIEQAGALVRDGISIHDFLGFHQSQYQELMGEKPATIAWNYDKNMSIISVFKLALSKLKDDHDAPHLLSLFSCFGPNLVAVDLLTGFWEPTTTIGGPTHLDDSTLSKKIQWLNILGHNPLSFQMAIRRLQSLCLLKTRRDTRGSLMSASVHGTICKWRLETIDEEEREDCIMLAALVLSQSLPDIGMDAVPYLRHVPLIEYTYGLMQQYIEPSNREAPSGRFCQQYAAVNARYAQVYIQSQHAKEAEAMLTASIEYEQLLQGSTWPQDRKSLLLLKYMAMSLLKCGKFDDVIPVLESLCTAKTELLEDVDDISVWAAAQLRNVREKEIRDRQLQQHAVIATNTTKRPSRLEGAWGDNSSHAIVEARRAVLEDPETPLSDEEYYLNQAVIENERLSGPSDNDTLQAICHLARFYKKSKLYFKAGTSFERLWKGYYSNNNEKGGTQALADAVDCYKISNRLSQLIELNNLKDGLTCAAWYGDERTVRTLILAGAEINGTDEAGQTALYLAASSCHERIVRRLLREDANVEICSVTGTTALRTALMLMSDKSSRSHQLRAFRIVRMLVKAGANVIDATKSRQSEVWTVAQTESIAYLKTILDMGVLRNDNRGVALRLASLDGDDDALKLLLRSGIYDDLDGRYFVAAMQRASKGGHSAVVRQLHAHKAQAFDNFETLSKVFSTSHLEVIQILFTLFIDFDVAEDPKACVQRNLALQAVLCAILDTGNPLLLKMLCEREIDIHQSTYPISSNATLLHSAAYNDHVEIAKILIAMGADVDKLDDLGRSPLLFAAEWGHEDVVVLLLPIIKYINAQDFAGRTALSYAVSGEHDRVVKMLLKAGAQIAPQEPGPHSRLVLESERISGYGVDVLLTFCLDERWIRPSGVENDIFISLLKAAITGECNPDLDIATVTAERFNELLRTKTFTRAASTSEQSLEVVREEDLEGWEKWVLARAASANRNEVMRLTKLAKKRTRKRVREMGEIWDATLSVKRAKKLKRELDWYFFGR